MHRGMHAKEKIFFSLESLILVLARHFLVCASKSVGRSISNMQAIILQVYIFTFGLLSAFLASYGAD